MFNKTSSKTLIVLCLGQLTCLAICAATLWLSGDRLDCRPAAGGGAFCALRTRSGAGVSIQYAGGLSVWKWGRAGESWQVWPGE